MTITITTLTRCAGQNHYHIAGTVNGVARTITIHRSELDLDPTEVVDAFVARVRSDLKENSITTFAAAKTRLEGRTFQL
jgi:hypothetical protein